MSEVSRRKIIIADSALALIAFIWGIGFVATKDALSSFPPYWLLTIRFSGSFLLMLIIFKNRLKKLTALDVKAGMLTGIFLFLGFAFQTVGLNYTTASKQAFITGTYVVIVPFLVWAVKKAFPGYVSFVASFLCLIGLALLTLEWSGNPFATASKGDLLTLFCALFFACDIILVEHFVQKMDPLAFATLKVGTAAILSLICALSLEKWPSSITPKAWLSMVYLTLFCTVFAYSVQNMAQKFTPSTHASILLSLESVFGALSGIILLGELFTPQMILGSVLIFIAILLTELGPKTLKRVFFSTTKEQAKSSPRGL